VKNGRFRVQQPVWKSSVHQSGAQQVSSQRKELTMSRGLGVLQREILDSLDTARQAQASYDRGWVLYRRVDMQLIEGVYDLRVVSKYLRAHRQIPAWQGERFAPMFSRAVVWPKN